MHKDTKVRHKKLYRVLVAIVFGLIGFGVNFIDIELFESPTFKISILLGLLFPLLIAQAWGWRYGLLSALAGGCQTMWWLWGTNGYGFLYAVPVFTVWVVWHGYWADRRRSADERHWYYSALVVEIPFRIISELGFYTIFRWLVSLNPPPWNPSITWDNVPLSWVNTVAAKHFITAYLLLLTARVLLSFTPVRRFFGMKKQPAERLVGSIYAGALLMGALLWVVDGVVDYLAFNPQGQPFWEVAILNVDPQHLFIRNMYIIVSVIAGVFVARLITERVQAEERIEHLNLVLRAIRNVNQLIVTEKDRGRLLQRICESLIETRGYFNVWIACLDEEGVLAASAEAGLGKSFSPLVEQFKRGELTDCGRRALAQAGIVTTEDPSACADCPLATSYAGRGAMTIRLEHDGKVYGLLSASIPAGLVADEEEQSLFQEVAEDIALALDNIELEHERARAEQALQESEAKLQSV
ncbi:MAG: GAF domain-containing protein, partial [Chloroflexota bacterium]|nr:GAF domain-containing protein [Chloroflexota bacterium]